MLVLGAVSVFCVGFLFSPVMMAASRPGFYTLAVVTQLAGMAFLIAMILWIAADR